MRKLLFSFFIFSAQIVYALPAGNIAEPELYTNGVLFRPGTFFNPCNPCYLWIDDWSLRIGFYGDYVFDRDLEVVKRATNDKLDNTRMITNGGYLALNFSRYATLFLMLGGTNFDFLYNQDILIATIATEIVSKTGFAWSGGGHLDLLRLWGFSLGLKGQYFATYQKLDYIMAFPTGVIEHFDNEKTLCYQEWQVSGGLAYRICTMRPRLALVPYVAGSYSEAKFNMRHTLVPRTTFEIPNFRFKKRWGFSVGATLTLCDAVGVTVEGRLGPEKAVYVNGQLRF